MSIENYTYGVAILNKELDKVQTKIKASQQSIDEEKEKIAVWQTEAKQLEESIKLIKEKGDSFEV